MLYLTDMTDIEKTQLKFTLGISFILGIFFGFILIKIAQGASYTDILTDQNIVECILNKNGDFVFYNSSKSTSTEQIVYTGLKASSPCIFYNGLSFDKISK